MITSAVSPLTKVNPAGLEAANATASSRIPSKILKQDDFLKLVVTQLANQDPFEPQADTQFIAQMTQFTALEQTKNMQGEISQMRMQQQVLQAAALLDREVVVQSELGLPITGVVKGFNMEGNEPRLVIGNQQYSLKDILTIRLANQQNT